MISTLGKLTYLFKFNTDCVLPIFESVSDGSEIIILDSVRFLECFLALIVVLKVLFPF